MRGVSGQHRQKIEARGEDREDPNEIHLRQMLRGIGICEESSPSEARRKEAPRGSIIEKKV